MRNNLFVTSYILTICIVAISCSNKGDNINECREMKVLFSLEKNKVVSFQLDSITSPHVNYIKMVDIDDTLYLSFLNPYNNTIYCYEYESRKLNKTIHLTNPKKLSGYEIVSWDKILAYHYWSKNLTWQNEKGIILNSIMVLHQENGFCTLPTSYAPIIYKEQYVYLVGAMMSRKKTNKKSHIIAQIDSSFSNINYLYHFPDLYARFFFGGEHYRMDIAYTYNSQKDIFVFNFPASHKLFVTQDFINEKEYCAGSRFVKSIPSYPYKGYEKSFKYCAENAFYHSILYDKYNNVYYRICLLPTKWQEEKPYDRDLSIIILDEFFIIIGEKLLKNNSDFYLGGISAMYISPDGISFRQKNAALDENSINFVIYKLVKN